MRQIISGLILIATATGVFAAQPVQWVNKYPFDKINGQTIFQTAELKTVLKKLPPTSQNLIVKQYTVSTPVEKSGESILISGCMPHFCNTASFMLVYNTKSKEYWVLLDKMNDKFDYEKSYCYSSSPNLSSMPLAFYNVIKPYKEETVLNHFMKGNVCK